MSSSSGSQTNRVLRQPDLRSEKIAKAKWDFLFGAPSEECCLTEGAASVAPSRRTAGSSVGVARDSVGQRLLHHKVQQIAVELFTPDPRCTNSGIIRRTLKYSETDLDTVPLRCYRETDLDQVMQAEADVFEENETEVDSAFGSDRSILGASCFSPEDVKSKYSHDEESKAGSIGRGENNIRREMIRDSRPLGADPDPKCGLKSPIALNSPRCSSDGNLDSFSRHFENIMESHRAKGTSYSSLDSVDVLTTGSTSVFTFDLPTLTPEIQTQISDTARQLMDLSFAPLSRSILPSASGTTASEVSPSVSKRTQDSSAKKDLPRKEGFKKVSSAPSLHVKEHVKRPPELLYPQAEVAQRLTHADSIDALNGIKADLQAAKRLAQRLYSLEGFKKSDVARHLNKNNEFSCSVAEEYLSLFDFSGLSVDQALRLFLRRLALMGETQERERLLTHFSHRYTQCNPQCLNTEDSVHTLTCAVMLLNSDLHGNNLGKRMSCSQFISNLEGLNDGKDFPKELLKTLYTSIRSEKLQWTIDEEEVQKSGTTVATDARKDSASHTLKRQGPSGNSLLNMAQQTNEQLYKSGLLVRKVHADPDGKRTPRGKRGWKSFHATLKGLVLYLQKEEYRSGQELTQEDLKNAVSVHHSLAMRAVDYSKRANVFYLRTADWRVFLLQASTTEQMQSWITRINIVSAMFSAPPFPPAIGSQKRFSRPLLPGSNSKLSQEDQLKSHENRFRAVSAELTELISDSKSKGREVEEQKQRQEYLEFEKTRYGTYAMLMRAKLQFATDDLSAFESRLLSESGLQRAHSSPALPQYSSLKDRGPSSRFRSLKVTSTQTKEESQNGTKPDNNAESKTELP
uniref:PH and SEC7 domain-containing protein 1-like n=1 Tax=Knipowitschia caucasica TaxID=637954 RepID=A0AAV2JQZ4_KNICA